MFSCIRDCVSKHTDSDVSFSAKYNEYVMQVQDMDIENEILPLIKRESTEYIKLQNRLMRQDKRNIRKMAVDFQH